MVTKKLPIEFADETMQVIEMHDGRLLQKRSNRPIVLVSGFTQNHLDERLLGLAHVEFLAKPYTRAQITHAIAVVVEGSRLSLRESSGS